MEQFQLLITCWCRFIPESARWLLSNGRVEEAKELLQQASKKNGVEIPDSTMDSLLENNTEKSAPVVNNSSFLDLFRYPNLRKKSLLIFFNWLIFSLIFYFNYKLYFFIYYIIL